MKFWSILFCFATPLVTAGPAGSVSSDCTVLGSCLTSLTDHVNKVMSSSSESSRFKSNYTTKGIVSSTSTPSSLSGASPMSFTINDCAQMLEDRLLSFQDFDAATDTVWNDVSDAQKTMVAVEEASTEVLKTEAEFATQLADVADLMVNATDRASILKDWVDGEKVVRNQLTDLYNVLDKRVIGVSDDVVVTTSAIRDALMDMQKVHDHATKILTAVGDSETEMYLWAYNVSQKVNAHTVGLVSLAQTLQYRTNQVNAVKDANIKLNWVVTQLYNKYGQEKLTELSKDYEAGTLQTPPGAAQGPTSSSVTTKTNVGKIPMNN